MLLSPQCPTPTPAQGSARLPVKAAPVLLQGVAPHSQSEPSSGSSMYIQRCVSAFKGQAPGT